MPHSIKFNRTFSAAHRLNNYQGACHRIHGHNYRVEVTIASPHLVPPGFIVDFGVVKNIIDAFDHHLILCKDDPLAPILMKVGELFVTVDVEPTTESLADLLAAEIFHEVASQGPNPWWVGVVLHETDNIQAESFHGDGPWENMDEELTLSPP